jgi:acyl-coenzyme A synthetase/AMP-(fatty) acid ligase
MALAARMNDQEAKNYFPRMLLMGAPAPHDIKLQLSKKFNVELIESWGNSEGLGTISFPTDWQCRLGTVGRPFVSEHISIVDDHGRDLGVGEVGRVAGLDESYFTEYCSRPEATEAAKVDGFVISDDLGYQDADGYLYLKGRRQQSFVFNENTFFSLELENEIIGSKLVSECAVIPSLSEEVNGNIMLRIFVVPIPGNDETDIIFQISGMVGDRTGIPASELVILVRQFLPKTPSGKVDLATLSKNDP